MELSDHMKTIIDFCQFMAFPWPNGVGLILARDEV
jgi:hypothetical protein